MYGKLEQPDKALTDFNQAIKLNSQYAEAYNSRGILYSNWLNNISQGRQDLEKAANLFLEQGNTQSYQRVKKMLQQL